ncbi:MAG: Ldh family oxidoreductase [Candidatus Eisenbacteria bacterium]|uniref:Ldh family oxidoreductase n=1 Tax=Eiseniibacteriota bacterium TaxID=2212470 RepID=A0A538TBI8_UNCEI|nr:MAG: Ldh family oxidoreductase [Candidatus Eisenbacteria bacterium]
MTPLRVISAEHDRFAKEVLVAAGADDGEAAVVSGALLWAGLRGLHLWALDRLPILALRLRRGLIRSPARMTWEAFAPAAHRLDADNGFGQLAGSVAMDRAIRTARTEGIGFVVVRRSNHYGAAGYYGARAAEAGLLGITGTNAFPKVAPHGGTKPVLGTNPIAFACPTRGGGPILVDFSTAALSGGAVRDARKKGEPLPAGCALDAAGMPTQDPAAAELGGMLPAAGPKGFGLGIVVEILSGLLSGGAFGHEVGSLFHTWDRPADVGHFFLAIEIERFMPADEFLTRVDRLLTWIAASPAQDVSSPVRVPGARRQEYLMAYASQGIPIEDEIRRSLDELARDLGVAPLRGESDIAG